MSVQRQTSSARLRAGKWAGLALGPLAALADQQIVATTVFARCPENSVALTLGVGFACALVAGLGAALSWRARQATPHAPTTDLTLRTDRFIATLSAVFAMMCLLFILFATPAGLILRCERF
jgi:hypothetical protein